MRQNIKILHPKTNTKILATIFGHYETQNEAERVSKNIEGGFYLLNHKTLKYTVFYPATTNNVAFAQVDNAIFQKQNWGALTSQVSANYGNNVTMKNGTDFYGDHKDLTPKVYIQAHKSVDIKAVKDFVESFPIQK